MTSVDTLPSTAPATLPRPAGADDQQRRILTHGDVAEHLRRGSDGHPPLRLERTHLQHPVEELVAGLEREGHQALDRLGRIAGAERGDPGQRRRPGGVDQHQSQPERTREALGEHDRPGRLPRVVDTAHDRTCGRPSRHRRLRSSSLSMMRAAGAGDHRAAHPSPPGDGPTPRRRRRMHPRRIGSRPPVPYGPAPRRAHRRGGYLLVARPTRATTNKGSSMSLLLLLAIILVVAAVLGGLLLEPLLWLILIAAVAVGAMSLMSRGTT